MTKEAKILRELAGIRKAMNAIIRHQKAIARCLQPLNYKPLHDQDDTASWTPDDAKNYILDAVKWDAEQARSGR
jgi:hypothetical protein